MTEGDTTRLIAWGQEMRAVHDRLRRALQLSAEAVADGRALPDPGRELLVFCHGFCTALDGHHRGEDTLLFPAIRAAHPDLADQLRKLEQDHSMIGYLVAGLQADVDRSADAATLGRHLDGIGAIMESHFRFEERTLLTILDRVGAERIGLAAPVADVLGPL